MAIQKKVPIVKIIWYLVLFLCASWFVWKNVVDFLEGKTMYSTEHVPISLHDIPTMTICLSAKERLVYAKHLSIVAKVLRKDALKLELNRGVQAVFGLQLYLSELRPNWHRYNNATLTCYKVSTNWNGKLDQAIDMEQFVVQLIFNYSIDPITTTDFICFSSEANSYGVAGRRSDQ